MKQLMFRFIAVLGLFVITSCSQEQQPEGKMPPVLEVGNLAPDFDYQSLFDSTAEFDKISQQKGKVIYLDFWASWCKPCLKSMPLLNEFRAEINASGFEVIAVNLDNNPERGREFLRKYPVEYPVVRAKNEEISELYQINGLPTSYLIDSKGVIRYSHQGFKDQDMDTIRTQVLLLLNE